MTATVKVPLRVVVIPSVYVGPDPLRVPLVMPLIPLRVMSLAVKPVIAWLKVRVKVVVAADVEPLTVTLLNETGAA